MKKLGILVLALAVIVFCFTGCSIKSQLSGTSWKEIAASKDGQSEEAVPDDQTLVLHFEKNGSGIGEIAGSSLAGTWTAEGDTLTVSVSDGTKSYTVSATVKITGKKMKVNNLPSDVFSDVVPESYLLFEKQ